MESKISLLRIQNSVWWSEYVAATSTGIISLTVTAWPVITRVAIESLLLASLLEEIVREEERLESTSS